MASNESGPDPLGHWQALADLTSDEARPEAVAKRHAKGYRTARENLVDLVDDGSFLEYGQLAVAAQRSRRDLDELRAQTPADGVITGLATINAADFGATVATRTSWIGMAGPAMIEGGGLGRFRPDEIGPIEVQSKNGVVDLVVDDEAEATAAARKLLGYFQGRTDSWTAADQAPLRVGQSGRLPRPA